VRRELALGEVGRGLFRLELLPPPLGLVHGFEPELTALPLPEDRVLHFAELLHDHLDSVGVDKATLCQKTLRRNRSN
jgi:hypothetical protein